MRISDWSSDVCSSDLTLPEAVAAVDGVVELGTGRAIPEIEEQPIGVDQIDLAGDGCLDNRAAAAAGQRAQRQAIIDQRAAIVEHAVDTRIEAARSDEHTSELQSLMPTSSADF